MNQNLFFNTLIDLGDGDAYCTVGYIVEFDERFTPFFGVRFIKLGGEDITHLCTPYMIYQAICAASYHHEAFSACFDY